MDLDLIRAMLSPTTSTQEAQQKAAKRLSRRAYLDRQQARDQWRAYLGKRPAHGQGTRSHLRS